MRLTIQATEVYNINAYISSSITVQYKLTHSGATVKSIICEMAKWGKIHEAEICRRNGLNFIIVANLADDNERNRGCLFPAGRTHHLHSKIFEEQTRDIHPFRAASEMTTPMRGFGGIGVALQTINGYRYFSHNGENQGFVCEYIGSMDGGYGTVVMTNGENLQLIKKIIKAIAEIYHWPGYQNFAL